MMPRDTEWERRQGQRNWIVLAVLAGLVVLIYAVTIVKIKWGAG